MHLIDTHAHIYLPEFNADRPALLEAARNSGIQAILMPAIDSATHDAMLRVEEEFPYCLSMMGLHPCSVQENYHEELKLVEEYLRKRPFIAVGEIGLDFYWDKTHVDQQYQAFRYQIELALELHLPVVIHSRNAVDECIDAVEKYPGLTGVFHCFSGTYEQAERIRSLGLMLGIGGVLTFKNSGLDKVMEKTGLDGVILETDAPYLAPVPHRGKRNQPAYTRLVAAKLSDVLGVSLEKIAEITTGNAKKLFKLS